MRNSFALLKAVVDTNLFVSASILQRGTPHELLGAWERSAFTLLTSVDQRGEERRTLSRPKFASYGVSPVQVRSLLSRMLNQAVDVSPVEQLPVAVRDVKDRPILAAALGGGADYLVTGDDDLLVLAGDPRLGSLRIVTARAFLEILAALPEGPGNPS
jgi:putative PIN family toxin of toxin-antitoxin system